MDPQTELDALRSRLDTLMEEWRGPMQLTGERNFVAIAFADALEQAIRGDDEQPE